MTKITWQTPDSAILHHKQKTIRYQKIIWLRVFACGLLFLLVFSCPKAGFTQEWSQVLNWIWVSLVLSVLIASLWVSEHIIRHGFRYQGVYYEISDSGVYCQFSRMTEIIKWSSVDSWETIPHPDLPKLCVIKFYLHERRYWGKGPDQLWCDIDPTCPELALIENYLKQLSIRRH